MKYWCILEHGGNMKTLLVKVASHERPYIVWFHFYIIFIIDKFTYRKRSCCLGQWGSVGRAQAHKMKDSRSDPQQSRCLYCGFSPSRGVCKRQQIHFSLSHQYFSPSLPLSLNSISKTKRKGKEKVVVALVRAVRRVEKSCQPVRAIFPRWWNVLQLIVMAAQLCKYTRNHWAVYFKRVNFMVCELCIKKAVI